MEAPAITVKRFDELTLNELHDLLRLRSEVFVVEQNCVYQDIDGLDPRAVHLFIRDSAGVSAYARIYPKEGEEGVYKIGRVVTRERRKGLGRRILLAAIEAAESLGARGIYVEAQEYAIGFYERAGFAVTSGVFLEDGIPHVQMRLELYKIK